MPSSTALDTIGSLSLPWKTPKLIVQPKIDVKHKAEIAFKLTKRLSRLSFICVELFKTPSRGLLSTGTRLGCAFAFSSDSGPSTSSIVLFQGRLDDGEIRESIFKEAYPKKHWLFVHSICPLQDPIAI
jgi:hypothetical protein